jgi:hypothetical protein
MSRPDPNAFPGMGAVAYMRLVGLVLTCITLQMVSLVVFVEAGKGTLPVFCKLAAIASYIGGTSGILAWVGVTYRPRVGAACAAILAVASAGELPVLGLCAYKGLIKDMELSALPQLVVLMLESVILFALYLVTVSAARCVQALRKSTWPASGNREASPGDS